VLTYLYVVLTQ